MSKSQTQIKSEYWWIIGTCMVQGDEETSVESNERLNHSKWTQEQGIDWAIDPDSIRTHHGQNGVVLHLRKVLRQKQNIAGRIAVPIDGC